ncbi:MAG: hypothetical protein IKE66_02860 [Hyphomicrobium sp.]|nr:hypothetical protein [Hyphomicrobium sp.]
MATTANPVLSKLHERLNRAEERIAHIRGSSASELENFESTLADFADRHQAIRSLIDETATETALAKADKDTSDLEAGLERWFADIDRKFADGPPRVNSVSM